MELLLLCLTRNSINPSTANMQPTTLTQGQSYMGGTVQYDTATGKPLAKGATTLSQPAAAPQAPAPVSSPVVSGSTAANYVANTIKPALTAANQAVTTAQQQAKERSIALASGQITDQASMDKFKAGQQQTTQTSPSATDQAAIDIANTPDAEHKWAYLKDGTRFQIGINQDPAQWGASAEKPVVAPRTAPTGAGIVEEVPLDDNTSYAKMGDGSYAKFATDGTFLGSISSQAYENSKLNSNKYQIQEATKQTVDLQNRIMQIVNGTYPLSPDQQAQIDSVKQTFQRLIDEQVLANKNYQGGIQVAQGLSGMSEYSPTIAMGTLKQAIDQGITKVADLNTKLLNTVSQMNLAFRSDNMKMLQQAYENYQTYADKKQAELDKITAAAAAHEKDMRDYNFNVAKEQADQAYKETTLAFQDKNLSYQEKRDKAQNALQYAQLDETKRHNIQTELNAAEDNRIRAAGLYEPVNGDTPFASTIDTVAQLGSTNQERKSLKAGLAKAAQSGDWKTFQTQLLNAADKAIPASEKTNILNATKELAQLNQIQSLIQQYQAAGGDMGYLKGTYDQVLTKFGQLATDPRFKDIANQMTRAFQDYRLNMTGAAFGAKESAEYQSVYPGGNNTMDLNLSKINSAKRYLNTNVNAVYDKIVGPGYENAAGLAKAQDVHEEIAAMDPMAALKQSVTLAQGAGITDKVKQWASEPWPDGTKKDGNDILFFTRQLIGIE